MNASDREIFKKLMEQQGILLTEIEKLSKRVALLEVVIAEGKGGFKAFLWLLSAIGTIITVYKLTR